MRFYCTVSLALFLLSISCGLLCCSSSAEPAALPQPDAATPVVQGTIRKAWRLKDSRIGAVTSKQVAYVWDVSDVSSPRVLSQFTVKKPLSDVIPVSENAIFATEVSSEGGRTAQVLDVRSETVLFAFPLNSHFFKSFSFTAVSDLICVVEDERFRPDAEDVFVTVKVVNWQKHVVILDTKLKKPLRSAGFNGCPLEIAPDGKRVAFATRSGVGSLGVIEIETGQLAWCKEMSDIIGDVAWHPDGGSVFVGTCRGGVERHDAQTGELLERWGTLTFPTDGGMFPGTPTVTGYANLLALDVSPDGKYLAVDTDGSLGVVVYDIAAGAEFKRIEISKYPIEQALFFSADSKGIWAAGSSDRQLKYFKVVE
jgi:WD40 repeat protein